MVGKLTVEAEERRRGRDMDAGLEGPGEAKGGDGQ